MSNILHVILTGGVGSRLWPLSRISRPKQYLNIFADHSLFELTVIRNRAFSTGFVVVGNQGNKHHSEQSLKKLGISEYLNIVEAVPRNTAPAIGFAAFAAQPEDILFITPSDHIIKEGNEYINAVKKSIELAEKNYLVTFGIRPTRPETGFGYIEYKNNDVVSFREKPDVEMAKEFLSRKNFLWNSGMFCFKAGVYLEELKKYSPEIYYKTLTAWKNSDNYNLEKKSSLDIPSMSVDYAVMEKSEKIKVVQSDFNWSDMGSFESVYDYLKELGHPVDGLGNMTIGTNKHTSFVGLQDCIFVSTNDADLIVSKNSSQGVKNLFQELEKTNLQLVK